MRPGPGPYDRKKCSRLSLTKITPDCLLGSNQILFLDENMYFAVVDLENGESRQVLTVSPQTNAIKCHEKPPC